MQSIIDKLGLPQKESDVLLALIQLGPSTVSRIAQKANLNRTTCYDILEKLNIYGLVAYVGDNNKKMFAAESPETLISYLDKKCRVYESRAEELKKYLPDLKAMYSDRKKGPRVRYYEGIEGIEAVYEDTLTSTEPIRAYASVEDMHAALPDYFPDYYQRRAQKNIAIRAILPNTVAAQERKEKDKDELRESRLVPADVYNFSPEINIYDNKVAIMSLAEEFGVIIESKEIAESQKKIFELAWIGASTLAQHN